MGWFRRRRDYGYDGRFDGPRDDRSAPPQEEVYYTKTCAYCRGRGTFQGQNWNITCGPCRGRGYFYV